MTSNESCLPTKQQILLSNNEKCFRKCKDAETESERQIIN